MISSDAQSLRTIVTNFALIAVWLPVLFLARDLVNRVIAGNPSQQLLIAAHLAVIGTLIIITAAYIFGIVLINKFATQNVDGAQQRLVRPVVLTAVGVYVAVIVVLFG